MTTKKKNNKVAASVSSSSSTSIFTSATRTRRVQAHASDAGEFARLAADFTPGYSNASYYTTLGLYAMSLPGLYSIIKRSTKEKVVLKTYEVAGPAASENPLELDALARMISTHFIKNNYNIASAGEVVTFEGNIEASKGQAAFLVFCTFVGLGSMALVLSIQFPQIGDNFYWSTLISPLAGVFYWENASRKEEVQVKMITSDDDTTTDVRIQGPDGAVQEFRRALELNEKGMVRVKGIFE